MNTNEDYFARNSTNGLSLIVKQLDLVKQKEKCTREGQDSVPNRVILRTPQFLSLFFHAIDSNAITEDSLQILLCN